MGVREGDMERMVDAVSLVRSARTSKGGEAFHVVVRRRSYKVGIGARSMHAGGVSHFIEVFLNTPHHGEGIDISSMADDLEFLKTLSAMGFDCSHEEDGSVTCELVVAPEKLEDAMITLLETIERIY